MYESKIYQPGYHSKENFILYNFNVTLSLFIKRLISYIGLNVIAFYFQSYKFRKKTNQTLNVNN